jgi:O-antigen/teichoic acid export membrane protein
VRRDSEAAEATRGGAVKLGAELLSRALQLLTSLLLARGLGAAEFGAFGALAAVALVAAEAADLGLHGTATRALVAGTLSLRAILRAKLVLGAVFLVASAAVLPLSPMLTPLLLWFFGSGWAEILGVALRARGRRGQEAAVLFVLRFLGLPLVAFALGAGGRGLACSWALALSTLPACLLGVALVRRAYTPSGEGAADPGAKAVLRTSAPLAVNGGLALLSLRVELLVLSALRGEEEVGYFLAALQIVQVLNSTVPTSLCAGAMPALTREALRVGGGDAADPVRRRTAATVALAAAPASAGLALVAPALTEALYGAGYAPSADCLLVLALSLLPLFLNGVFTHALIAAERASWLPRLTAVRVALAALFAALLAPAWGGKGAAFGFVLSELALLGLGGRAVLRAGFKVAVARPALLALLATVPMVAVVFPLRARLPLAVAAGALAFGAAVLAFGASERLRRDLGYS